jgi:hypothetical protein
MLQPISFLIQKVWAQLKRLSFGRERALRVGPLREYLPYPTPLMPISEAFRYGHEVVFVGLFLKFFIEKILSFEEHNCRVSA